MSMVVECRTDCPIVGGGMCPRHKIHKHRRWVELCQTRDNYFMAWEEGRGPAQNHPVAAFRKSVGVGSEICRLLGRCSEFPHRDELNAWGPAGCEDHRDEIVAWLQEFSLKFQKLPMDRQLAERMLRLAIKRARATEAVDNSAQKSA